MKTIWYNIPPSERSGDPRMSLAGTQLRPLERLYRIDSEVVRAEAQGLSASVYSPVARWVAAPGGQELWGEKSRHVT
jgi:hypothetical protein